MEELGRTPVCFAWLEQALRFWNKIIDKEPKDLIIMALEESFDSNTGWVNDFVSPKFILLFFLSLLIC